MRETVILLLASLISATAVPASAQTTRIVAIGDSNTAGKGVSEAESYPAQLEAALRRRGLNVSVANAGINGDTSAGVLSRLDGAVPGGTALVILWVGVNDCRRGVPPAQIAGNIAAAVDRLRARSIGVVLGGANCADLRPIASARGVPLVTFREAFVPGNRQDGDPHLTGAGYRAVVNKLLPAVQASLGRARNRG